MCEREKGRRELLRLSERPNIIIIARGVRVGAREQLAHVQICRKICGLGCVNRTHALVQNTEPSPHIFLHICTCVCLLLVYSLVVNTQIVIKPI